MQRSASVLLPLVLLVGACSDDPSEPSTDAGEIDGADIGDSGGVDDTSSDTADDTSPDATPERPTGTVVAFDLAGADADFFAYPYPSDLRKTADGTLDVAGLPNPRHQTLYASLVTAASRRTAFPQLPVAWFHFDAPIAAWPAGAIGDADSDVRILSLSPEAADYGAVIPTVAAALGTDEYLPPNVLAVAPAPGWVLEPGTAYAAIVRRDYGDATGAALGVPERLWDLATGIDDGAPDAALFAPLWPALEEAGISPQEVAAATVFTTDDPAASLFALSELVRDRYDATISDLHVDPDDGATHPRFCELQGTLTLPQFQQGTPPYDTQGTFTFEPDGAPTLQGTVDVPMVLNFPLTEMPAGGFPLVVYFHGSGGLSSQVVDRGPDPDRAGEGPAHVLAAYGLATAGSAHPINPERVPGASSYAYLNLANLGAFPDTFRQGAIEQRLYLDALLELRVPPEVVAACAGLSLPASESAYRVSADRLASMGQSMGGMYANMITAVEPRFTAVVPTGAGGYWSYFILETALIPGAGDLLAAIIGTDQLSFMHPVLHMLQTAWSDAEPFAYVPRLASAPLPGHPARSIYEPVGRGDSYFPTSTYDAIALAYRNVQAGESVWAEMQERLALGGLDGLAAYPLTENLTSRDGEAYTGAVVQYDGDGVHDPHEIFQYYDEVKHQYGCFLDAHARTGVATIVAPAGVDQPCE
ncbi:MAG: hypothetical protein H6697_03530 [Myxococcales bacterium]|nr:hypothetical protein [Myxococcales bacterium]